MSAHAESADLFRMVEQAVLSQSLSIRERFRLLPPVHAFWYATRWVGLRARLRCPDCQAVGTWKPHGTFSARIFDKDRPVRRWLCKWCGHYNGPEGRLRCVPDPERGCWVLPWEHPEGMTPQRVVQNSVITKTWPWRG